MLETNLYFDSQNLAANFNDQFRNQFIIETILIINLEANYNSLISINKVFESIGHDKCWIRIRNPG